MAASSELLQSNPYDRWAMICAVFVIVGVILEVFETLAELKSHPAHVRFVDPIFGKHLYGDLVPETKPARQEMVVVCRMGYFASWASRGICFRRPIKKIRF
jgi:hypothetical protein